MEWAADGMPVRFASARKRSTSSSSMGFEAQPRGLRTKIWMAWAVSCSARSNARETPPAMPSWAPRIMAGHLIHQRNRRRHGQRGLLEARRPYRAERRARAGGTSAKCFSAWPSALSMASIMRSRSTASGIRKES